MISDMLPLQRLGEPEDIGEAALYLSAGASWMTGNTLTIDGGELIRIAGELPIEEG
jgi:NAD(P)-dependent dehydrogenase (short-subunit alcohol dehydrogenase family)